MKITVFTSNQPRHLSLIRSLSNIASEVYAVMEVNTLFAGKRADFFKQSEVMQRYFSKVMASEKKIFGDVSLLPSNVKTLTMKMGDLNDVPTGVLREVLQSDVYVVFGSSYIKGELADYLVENKALNIHMGVSPYYRGSSCNFWAGYDGNYELIGATIHLLSKGLDSGDILFHALPAPMKDPFDLGMRAVLSAHTSLAYAIKDGSIYSYEPVKQDKSMQIRYTRNKDFTDEVALDYLDRQHEMNLSNWRPFINLKVY